MKKLLPRWQAVVPIWMAEIKLNRGWTDADLARYLAVSERTVQNIRAHPGRTSADNVLMILDLRNQTIDKMAAK